MHRGDFLPALQHKEVLTPGRVVSVAEAVLWGAAEDRVLSRLGGDAPDGLREGVQVVEVGLAVIAGKYTHDVARTSAY